MRVLVVHNRYRSAMPSGENRVVDDEVAMLREAGMTLDTYIRDSDEIDGFGPLRKAGMATRPIYSPQDVRLFRQRLESFRPDVVHLHNPFPLISPAVVRVAKDAGVPVVQTVHNYRHVCAKGTFFRDGHICHDCSGRMFPWPAVAHGCYRGSRAQSAVMASALASHRSTWQLVDRFLAVSEFTARHLRECGVPAERIIVKPNAVPDPGEPTPPGNGFLFAGRLDLEKGVTLLLRAWELSGLGKTRVLTIAGDGPERDAVRDASRRLDGIRFAGAVDRASIAQLLADCGAVVVPSLCEETFSLVVAEAFAAGRAVVATTVGALGAMVDPSVGWSVQPTVTSLADALVAAHSADLQITGERARLRFFEQLRPQAASLTLQQAYEQACRGVSRRKT